MGPFIAAWLVGEGIIVYRSVKKYHAPPSPGALLFSSGLFIALGLLAESERARTLAVTLAWGFDIAALMNLWNVGTGAPSTGKHSAPPEPRWPPPDAGPDVIFPGTGSGGGGPNKPASNTTNQQPLKQV